MTILKRSMRNKTILICVSLLIFCSEVLFADLIEDYFDEGKPYTEHQLRGIRYPGGGFIRYDLDDWNVSGLVRLPFLGDLVTDEVIPLIRSSNQLQYELRSPKQTQYTVRGIELHFNEKVPISAIGYELTNGEDFSSEYYVIGFLNSPEDKSTLRIIAFLSDSYELFGEIVSANKVYFIRGAYKKYHSNSGTVLESHLPSLISIERINQRTMGVTSLIDRTVLWKLDNLSFEEEIVTHFATSVVHSIRFSPKIEADLKSRREDYLDTLSDDNFKEADIIDEKLIPSLRELVIEEEIK